MLRCTDFAKNKTKSCSEQRNRPAKISSKFMNYNKLPHLLNLPSQRIYGEFMNWSHAVFLENDSTTKSAGIN